MITKFTTYQLGVANSISTHYGNLFHGLPRSISSRSTVIARERERAVIEDILMECQKPKRPPSAASFME